jgi:predicted HTH transcriptional regulator
MKDEFRDIDDLIEAGELDRLIGCVESAVFEAKGSRPYDFSQAFGRWELAKDVASFANSDGGFIIIGLVHDQLPEQDTDRVSALDLIEESTFESSRYKGIVNEYVDGKISGLQVKWVQNKDKPGHGVGVIHIPPQPNDAKPFLLKQIDESGKTRQLVFGIASRKGAHSVPSTLEELRKALSHGTSNTATRLTRIEEQLASMHDRLLILDERQQQPSLPSLDPLDSRIEQALETE